MIDATPQPLYSWQEILYQFSTRLGGGPESVYKSTKNIAGTAFQTLNFTDSSESLYQVR